MASSDCLVVCAIDIGTTFSGWAYSFVHEFRSDPMKATVRNWHSGSDTLVTGKTPTCALISPDGTRLEAFGYEAENKYRTLAEKGQHKDYYYFRRFKMSLNSEAISRGLMIKDEMDKKFQAINVFSLSTAYLVENMLSTCQNAIAGGICKSDIHWVLTVPAIWSDAAKQFMREAAEKHPANIDPKRLFIALEPEAASVFCRHLPVEKVKGSDTISKLPAGSKYLVLDAGGGTIDITVHEVTSSGGLKEVHAASGGGCGGILVDEEFTNLLTDILGKHTYEKFKKTETEDWLDLWRAFEVKKKIIEPKMVETINMKLPLSLIELYNEESGLDLKSRIKQTRYSSMIQLSRDKVRYDASLMKSLFQKSMEKTVSHVRSVLIDGKVRDVKAILMVGGYSDSPMLQDAVKREFSDMKVVIPNEASSAILRGAVIFGHSPSSISHRVLKKTYGFEVCRNFIEGFHSERRKKILDGILKCDNIFSKHAERDESVSIGDPHTKLRYSPSVSNAKALDFRLFASDLKNPLYTDEGCIRVGTMSVDISDVPGDLDRDIDVHLIFGDTEIKATAKVKKTGKIVTASFNFLG